MTVNVVAELTSTDLNKASGEVLDQAARGPVRILRRKQRFVVLLEEELDEMLGNAREHKPQSLEEMLQGYDQEAAKAQASWFLEMPPAGKEII